MKKLTAIIMLTLMVAMAFGGANDFRTNLDVIQDTTDIIKDTHID